MPYDMAIFQQDLKAARNALEKDDLENMNILGNRVMSNCHIFNEKRYFLVGFLLKDMAATLLPLKNSKVPKAASTARALTAGVFRKLSDYAKGDIQSADLWKEYHEFSNKVRPFILLEFEEGAYGGDSSNFTHESIQLLLKKLEDNKDRLLEPNCILLKGMINEISRLHKAHGSKLHDEFAAALIVMLDRCYDYIAQISETKEIFENNIKNVIHAHLGECLRILKESEEKGGIWQQQIDDELFALVKIWREYFLFYMEKGEVVQQRKTTVMLPDESRKRLTEAIARTLEDELPKKNK